MKIIKSVREIYKEFVDACHGFIDNSSQYKEYDNKGNLVHINTYNSNCINWDEMSSTDDYAEDDVFNKYDDLGRLVERITKQKGLSLIEKYTYNDKGQELSYTRIKENDYKYRLDFSYETDEKDRLWKRGSVGGEILVFEVLDKLGKILFNTEISFPEDNNLDPEDLGYNEIIYNHNIYKYDINDRIIDQYSYNDLYAGNYLHLDYQEEDGIKTTKIIEYPLYVLGENITDIDLIENTDLFEILKDDNMINRKETVRQWEDKRHKVHEIKNELTGEERTTTDFLDDDNKVYKTTIYNYDKDGKADGHSIFLLNENGDRIDEKVFLGQPEQLVMHTVSYYSKEDGRILFSSSSSFKKLKFGDIVPQEFVSWYDYTYYD